MPPAVNEIKTKRELVEVYPQFGGFIEKMYARWMIAMASDKADEAPAGKSFVENFTQAVSSEPAVQHLVTYVETNLEGGSNPHAVACWLILVANDPEVKAGGSPEADADFFNGWRDSKPE